MRWRASVTLMVILACVRASLAGEPKEDLWAAAKQGDAKGVAAALARGADVNAKAAYGQTALWFAASGGHVEVVRVLIQHKADVNVKETFYGQMTPLTWAAEKGHLAVVQALLEAGATGADTLLPGAVREGKKELVKVLVEKGKLKPDVLNKALVSASKSPEISELLKKAGAKLPPPTPTIAVNPEALKPFVGTYAHEKAEFELSVALKEGKLVVLFGENQLYALDPIEKNKFKAGDDATITFRLDGVKVLGFTAKTNSTENNYKRVEKAVTTAPAAAVPARVAEDLAEVTSPLNWPSFRGERAAGVADGQHPPIFWDVEKGLGVVWKTPLPGFAHASPIIWGDQVLVTSAISGDPNTKLRVGLYGDVDSVNDKSVHTWKVYCLERRTGNILWERTACQGVPKVKRHMKASHANCTPATNGKILIVNFGSEGLYAYDLTGTLLWKKDLGTLIGGWFFDADYQWGFASSPILYRDWVIIQCDVGKGSFIAAYRQLDGRLVWRTPREEIPSWGTPTIVEAGGKVELVTNATKFIRGYDPETGKELWRLGRNAEITAPTPVAGAGLVFVTSGYRPIQPIYAIRLGGRGDLTLNESKDSSDVVAWSKKTGGPYMQTPIVYGDYLYTCSDDGRVTCYEVKTGKQIYRERLKGKGGYTASAVAADGRLYFTSEENGVRVVKAGPKFELLASNPLGDVCMATPAISAGMIFFRTQHAVIAVGRQTTARAGKPAPGT